MNKAPFRADHVGSFLRPPALLSMREKCLAGETPLDQLRELEDSCIKDIVKMQEDTGIESITDGDFRRTSWSSDFLTAIKGVEMKAGRLVSQSVDTMQEETPVGGVVRDWMPPTPVTTAKLEWPQSGIQRESFLFLKGVTNKTPKVTIPGPSMLHFRGGRGGVGEQAYPDMEEFFAEVSNIWRSEIMNLADAGCRYVQMDDTNLAYLCDTNFRQRVRDLGEDPNELPHRYSKLINDAIKDRPDDMAITVHLCRGNSLSRGHAEGGYEPIAEIMFNELAVDGFFLEYDSERAGDFQPLRFVPEDKKVVLGLVTSKFGELESKDEIKRRIDEAAKFMPKEQMCLSPQCGFASHTGGNLLAHEAQAKKLRLIVEIADEVWGNQ